jgi:hypothetical protein
VRNIYHLKRPADEVLTSFIVDNQVRRERDRPFSHVSKRDLEPLTPSHLKAQKIRYSLIKEAAQGGMPLTQLINTFPYASITLSISRAGPEFRSKSSLSGFSVNTRRGS